MATELADTKDATQAVHGELLLRLVEKLEAPKSLTSRQRVRFD
jgi:hypothetical protein